MTRTASIAGSKSSKSQAAQARRGLDALHKRLPVSVGNVRAPQAAIPAIERVLQAFAEGVRIAVLRLDDELTTQQAADLLRVSRPTLIKLLGEEKIPVRTTGVHRRIKAADVIALRDKRSAKRRTKLDRLAAEHQRLGLYND